MEHDEGFEDEGPFSAWLPPEDRLWRHPSEVGGAVPPVSPDLDATRDLDARLHATHGGMGTMLRSGPVRTWAVAVVAGVVGALLASGVSLVTNNFGTTSPALQSGVSTPNTVAAPDSVTLKAPTPAPAAAPSARSTVVATGSSPNWATVASAMAASVVGILASNGSAGSGVLYARGENQSYIVTTSDLGTSNVEVTFDDGEQASAHLVATDSASGLAVLAVPGTHYAIPTFGSVSDVHEAESLLAVTGGQGQATDAPMSVISVDDAAQLSDDQTIVNMLAVTGSEPTAEGGALVDAQNRVVGITTSSTSADPMQPSTSFAIPINLAVHVANQVLADRHVTHPYLGVLQAQDLSSVTAHSMRISGGATVETVAPGSPAADAGIATGDVITRVGPEQVESAGGLLSALCDVKPGTSVRVHYLHQGKPATVRLQVIEQPTDIDDPNPY